jgi:hypothetical protein
MRAFAGSKQPGAPQEAQVNRRILFERPAKNATAPPAVDATHNPPFSFADGGDYTNSLAKIRRIAAPRSE